MPVGFICTHRFDESIDPDAVIADFTAPMSFNYLEADVATELRSQLPESFQTGTVAADLTNYE